MGLGQGLPGINIPQSQSGGTLPPGLQFQADASPVISILSASMAQAGADNRALMDSFKQIPQAMQARANRQASNARAAQAAKEKAKKEEDDRLYGELLSKVRLSNEDPSEENIADAVNFADSHTQLYTRKGTLDLMAGLETLKVNNQITPISSDPEYQKLVDLSVNTPDGLSTAYSLLNGEKVELPEGVEAPNVGALQKQVKDLSPTAKAAFFQKLQNDNKGAFERMQKNAQIRSTIASPTLQAIGIEQKQAGRAQAAANNQFKREMDIAKFNRQTTKDQLSMRKTALEMQKLQQQINNPQGENKDFNSNVKRENYILSNPGMQNRVANIMSKKSNLGLPTNSSDAEQSRYAAQLAQGTPNSLMSQVYEGYNVKPYMDVVVDDMVRNNKSLDEALGGLSKSLGRDERTGPLQFFEQRQLKPTQDPNAFNFGKLAATNQQYRNYIRNYARNLKTVGASTENFNKFFE